MNVSLKMYTDHFQTAHWCLFRRTGNKPVNGIKREDGIMKRKTRGIAAFIVLIVLCLSLLPAGAEGVPGSVRLSKFVHNVTVTGKMAPAYFDPDVTCYLLTTGRDVNNVYFTCTTEDPQASMYINGQYVQSGKKIQVAWMNDNPQQVDIEVFGIYGDYRKYTVFLQRRPSDKRTRVSSGYITKLAQKDGVTKITADLVNVYYSNGNMSTFHNDSTQLYTYPCSANCVFYYGTVDQATRATSATEFSFFYTQTPDLLYRFVYIEDEIVAVMPYAAD